MYSGSQRLLGDLTRSLLSRGSDITHGQEPPDKGSGALETGNQPL